MIRFQNDLKGIEVDNLKGFFVGWPNPPSDETFYKMLQGSAYIWLAVDDESGHVVGFINAISDHVLSCYIPLLEVLPSYQKKGYGRVLVENMLESLNAYYVTDLMCDENMTDFYKKMGMTPARAMMRRLYDKQCGIE